MRRYRIEALVALLLVALTGAAFCRVFANGFVNYDDEDYVTRNPRVQSGLSWQGIGWGSIIYLAAITTIDPTLYESARADGAARPNWRAGSS